MLMALKTLEDILRWLAHKPVVLWLLAVGCMWGAISIDPYGHLGEIAAVVALAVVFTAIAIRRKDRDNRKPWE
jgi:4-hydroxybenzoate polyprenyltransferase